jgi:hypothetical protein
VSETTLTLLAQTTKVTLGRYFASISLAAWRMGLYSCLRCLSKDKNKTCEDHLLSAMGVLPLADAVTKHDNLDR